MTFFYIFLAMASAISSIYAQNNLSSILQAEIHHATNNTVDKLDKNCFTYDEKLAQCRRDKYIKLESDEYEQRCIESVRSELKQSIKDDARALGTIITLNLAAIAATNAAENARLWDTATAINKTRKIFGILPAITTAADACAKTILYIISKQ